MARKPPRLKTLQPRIATLDTRRLPELQAPRTKRITGRALQQIRRRFLESHPLCCMCVAKGVTRIAVEVDHIVPLYKGGSESDENRQGLCADHHLEKTRRDMGYVERKRIGVSGWPE